MTHSATQKTLHIQPRGYPYTVDSRTRGGGGGGPLYVVSHDTHAANPPATHDLHLLDQSISPTGSTPAFSPPPSPRKPDRKKAVGSHVTPPVMTPSPTRFVFDRPSEAIAEIDQFFRSLTPEKTKLLDPNMFVCRIFTLHHLELLPVDCWSCLPSTVLMLLRYEDVQAILAEKDAQAISAGKKGTIGSQIWTSLSTDQQQMLMTDSPERANTFSKAQQAFTLLFNRYVANPYMSSAFTEVFGVHRRQAEYLLAVRACVTTPLATLTPDQKELQREERISLLERAAVETRTQRLCRTFIPSTTKGKIIVVGFAILCTTLIVGSCIMCWPAYAAIIGSAISPIAFCLIIILIKLLAIALLSSRDLIAQEAYGNRNDITRFIGSIFASWASSITANPTSYHNPSATSAVLPPPPAVVP